MKRLPHIALLPMIASIATASALPQASGAADAFATAFQQARRELLAGKYLTAIEIVRPFALTDTNTVRDAGAFQVWDQMQAMVSGEPSPLNTDTADPPDQRTVSLVVDASSRDALGAIAERARQTRVVILNENHRTPCQRVFATRLAEVLRPLGYDTLALEALATVPSSTAADLRQRGYPEFGDGFYTREPAFAFFVRRSLQLGYAPLAYEADAYQIGDVDAATFRERGQARKLLAYLASHPTAKVLVYSGGGHLAERPLSDGSKMMGQWLRELSGIDPLTIDQNQLQPGSDLRRRVVRRKVPADAMLFHGASPLVVGSMAGRVDMQVLPAAPDLVGGRQRCLSGGGRRATKTRLGTRSKEEVLVQAFVKGESADAVPVDQAIVKPGKPVPMLLLPPAPVRLVVRRT